MSIKIIYNEADEVRFRDGVTQPDFCTMSTR